MSPKQRKKLKDEGGGKGAKKKKKKSGPGLFFFLFYGVGCAVGGIYFDRHLLPNVRIWMGQQAQTISGLGTEQAIRGHLEQGSFSASEQQAAMADVRTVYAAKTAGTLTQADLERLGTAEAPFSRASAGQKVSDEEVREALEIFADLAGR